MSVQRHTLSAKSVKTFPEVVEGNQLIFETKTLTVDAIDDGKAIGEVIITAKVNDIDQVEVGRQKLIPGDKPFGQASQRPLFLIPDGIIGPFTLTGELFPWITGSYLITVWASRIEVDNEDSNDCILSGELIEFDPMSSSEGIALGPGLAVFTAGETTFSLPSVNQPNYQQSYTVQGDAFWGIGARSRQSYSSGRFSFVSGTGRSVLGLTESFPAVDYRALRWAWYVHSPELVAVFERRPGESIQSRGTHSWSPDQVLSLDLVDGKVQYGIGVNVVYESPVPVTDPVYFCAVLGPQAFVVNCLRQDNG